MLVVVALGGNALLKRGEPMTAKAQRDNVRRAAKELARLVRDGHRLVLTHGNGPQVGLLALQGAAYHAGEEYPLDVLGAETEGMIGYMIEQELENALDHEMQVAALLTQVVVDRKDPAFAHPTKFVGPVYDKKEAEDKAKEGHWTIAQDGDKWRRVVPSPKPMEIPDIPVIQLLLKHDVIVICTGGGGIPVAYQKDGSLTGIEAVIDKDAASALLAKEIGADALLLLTDVDGVYRDFGTSDACRIETLSVDEALALSLPEGSMAPKVMAATHFVATGNMAGIGRLEDAVKILAGEAGTRISL